MVHAAGVDPSMPSFADLSNDFLAAEFADAPVRASGLGLTEYDDQLDDLSQAAYERRRLRDAPGSTDSAMSTRRRSRSTTRSTATSPSASFAAGRSWMTSRSGAGPIPTSIRG